MVDRLSTLKKAIFNKIEWLLQGSVKGCSLNFNHKFKKNQATGLIKVQDPSVITRENEVITVWSLR